MNKGLLGPSTVGIGLLGFLALTSACGDGGDGTTSGAGGTASGGSTAGVGGTMGTGSNPGSGGDTTALPDPCETSQLQGEPDAADAVVAANCDAFWFSGYETAAWTDAWALRSGPEQPSSQTLLTDDLVLGGSTTLQITYSAPGNGPVDQNGYGPDDGNQYTLGFENLPTPVAPKESAFLRYYVRFEPGFEFMRGGKLPGLIGGEANTGGDVPDGTDGWSARMMWRGGGKIVQYVYHPEIDEYGEDMNWNEGGQRYFTPGLWHCVETEVVMNSVTGTVGNHDGVVRSWLDDELALERTDVRFRDVETLQIDGLYFSTFFGGSDATWAPPTDQYVQYDNFAMSGTRIGCCPECDLGDYVPPDPKPSLTITNSELVFDGDTAGWSTSDWGKTGSSFDFESTGANHTIGGSKSASITLGADWDATIYEASSTLAESAWTHIVFWIMPSDPDLEFRVQLRGGTINQSTDVTVNGGPDYFLDGWQVGEFNEVIIPISAFGLAGATYDQILVRSASSEVTPQFYLDDFSALVATEN